MDDINWQYAGPGKDKRGRERKKEEEKNSHRHMIFHNLVLEEFIQNKLLPYSG